MNTKLFIASKIKVGFNPRQDTYTGKLGYVIGFDGKKWRKEPSWDGWRYHFLDKDTYEQKKLELFNNAVTHGKNSHANYVKQYSLDITKNNYYKEYANMTESEYLKRFVGDYEKFTPNLGRVSSDEGLKPLEFDNIPTEGFVLNKKAGGYSSGWNARATYCRVYDPRGFEFEISIPNLLFILQECNAMKGKGLEGSFVYAWDGKDLVLLPTNCNEYKQSTNFTNLQSGKVSVKDLLEGCTYKTKQLDEYIYLGKFNWFDESYDYNGNDKILTVDKKFIFVSVKNNMGFLSLSNLSTLVQRVTDVPIDTYATLLNNFTSSKHNSDLNNITFEDLEPPTSISYYRYGRNKDKIGMAFLPIGENKYEQYDLTAQIDYSGNGKYNVKNYTLTSSKILLLKDNGDFEVKKNPLKVMDKISYSSVKDLKLKIIKNNKNKQIHF